MNRGCMIIAPCGCKVLDGHSYEQCQRHAGEGGKLAPNPELDAWLKRQEEKFARDQQESLRREYGR